MSSIFISHSSRDAPTAALMRKALDGKGVWSWLDAVELRPGSRLTFDIQRGINDVTVFVLLLSPASLRSEWVRSEYLWAARLRAAGDIRKIVIIALEGIERQHIPNWMQADLVAEFIRSPARKHRDWIKGFAEYLLVGSSNAGVMGLPGRHLFETSDRIPKGIKKSGCFGCAHLAFTAHPHSGHKAAVQAESYPVIGSSPVIVPLCRHPDNTTRSHDPINGKVVESFRPGPLLNPKGACPVREDRLEVEGHVIRGFPRSPRASMYLVSRPDDRDHRRTIATRLARYAHLVHVVESDTVLNEQVLAESSSPAPRMLCPVVTHRWDDADWSEIEDASQRDGDLIVAPILMEDVAATGLGADRLWVRMDTEVSARLATRDLIQALLDANSTQYLHKLTQPSMVFGGIGLNVTGYDFVVDETSDVGGAICRRCRHHEFSENPEDRDAANPDGRAFSGNRRQVSKYLKYEHYNQVCRAAPSYVPGDDRGNQSAACVFKNLDGQCRDFIVV